MVTLLYYLLKVVICSGILYGYYRLALHNKVFHHWNRFYLIFSVILSLVLPLLRFNVLHQPQREDSRVIHLLTAVSTGDELVSEASRNPGFQVSSEQMIGLGYGVVSLIFILLFCHTLWIMYRLVSKNHAQKILEINFVNTEARGTPFSFFNYIFWNRNIEIDSQTGQQIFRHELAHVREKHSWDKLFLNIVLLFYWSNPIFWLIRRELNMIHEFIADSKSLDQYDTAAFAAMILQSVYPRQQFNLNNYFFYSPIKRRLLMLTKMKNTKVNYFSRVLVLPLLTLVFVAFTLKTKKTDSPGSDFQSTTPLARTVTFIIDPGHGGDDFGARGKDGAIEKNINLAIAKKVRDLNKNEKIVVLLTRDKDETMDLKQRTAYASSVSADAFVSLHVNSATPGTKGAADSSGFMVYVSSRNKNIEASSAMLGGFFLDEIKDVYKTSSILRKRIEQGIWVLDAPDINYASILIECGYLTNPKDTKFILDDKNQELIAKKILASLEKYVSSTIPNSKTINDNKSGGDSIPQVWSNKKIKFINFTIDGNVIITYKDGKQEMMSLPDAQKEALVPFSFHDSPGLVKNNPLFIINNKVMPDNFDINQISPEEIDRIEVYKDGPAVRQYGDRGRFGVISIALKNPTADASKKTQKNILYVVDGQEMYSEDANLLFDPKDVIDVTVLKGQDAVNKYGAKGENGVVIVNTNGNRKKENVITIYPERSEEFYIGEYNPVTIHSNNYPDDKIMVNVTNGRASGSKGKFVVIPTQPGEVEIGVFVFESGELKKIGGKNFNVKYLPPPHRPEGVKSDDGRDLVFSKVEVNPSFPGGESAWKEYINKELKQNADALRTDNQFGTCTVNFIIWKNGAITDVSPYSMRNSKIFEVIKEALLSGPKWNSAKQNGHAVNMNYQVSVTLGADDLK